MAFPGGHAEPEDADIVAAAIREAHEEVGIDLAGDARVLGRLDDLQSVARGRVLPMAISPVVFALDGERPPLTLDPSEVDDALWVPLDELANGDHDDTIEVSRGDEAYTLPCWRVQGECIWGLTYIMTHSLLQLLGRSDGAKYKYPAFRKR